MIRCFDVVVALTIAAIVSVPAKAVDSLTAARDLYAAAEYEDALAVLNRLQPSAAEPEELRAIQQYRAYCLLALGRSADAEKAIAAVVAATPLYKPSGSEASPRVRSAFSDVRRRMLPAIIQEKYAAAKAAFDRKKYEAADKAFGEVIQAMADPDVADIVNQPPLSDLRTLALGFRELSASNTPPPPIEARAAAPVVATPLAATAATPAAEPAPSTAKWRWPDMARVYVAEDSGILPPVAIRQVLPPFPATIGVGRRGVLEVVIGESGAVEQATMRERIDPRYDQQLVAAARAWQFRPATLDGAPVKYRKLLQVNVKP
jgi:tetratricopeptide (TPR) repeat protein